MATDLHARADQVNDEESFLRFLAALAADWQQEREMEAVKPSGPYSSGALGWENGTVGAVLDAAVRWGEASIGGLRFYEKPANPWRRAAHILHAGKFHE
jgi:hypothetical protein